MVREKAGPVVGHQRAIGLQCVAHALGGPTVEFTQLHRPLKEGEPPKGRFAALPQHRDLAVGARFEERLDVTFQGLLGHSLRRRVVEQLLGQEEAVLAIQVAGCPRRFGHHGEGDRSAHSPAFARLRAGMDEADGHCALKPSTGAADVG